ncbi:hypothetical protein [Hymenobacter sp. IS2118]|uniref:hypothetical protein n=1 Tax=Hymenobacter sp. IS2118 TaxID=1505605 RepID=UPI0012685115|nr:hypothetical protein [Hymenobacter sp. IS2118]
MENTLQDFSSCSLHFILPEPVWERPGAGVGVAESIKAMKDLKQFSVDDGVAIGFHYQAGKSIAIDFDGCYSMESKKYLDGLCSLTVENWASATAIHLNLDGDGKERPLESVLGIIDMVLAIESDESSLQLWVETIDSRYLLLKFRNAVAGFTFPEVE